jgi:hypothetical protein
MTQLSARARALLERAQKEATPSAQQLSQLRVKLAASLANQAPDPVLLPFSLGKFAGVMLAAALAALGASHARGLFEGPERRAPVVLVASRSPEAAPSCPPMPACAPVPVECVQARPVKPVNCAQPSGTEQSERLAHRPTEHNLFSAEAAQRDPSLELELLVLARSALDEDRLMDAVGHTLRHEQLYPTSAFEEERLAMQVLAWCSAGHPDKAAQQFKRLMALSPHTGYLPRIRGTCGKALAQVSDEAELEP